MKRPELYEYVSLKRDFDEYGLKRGDVATLIDVVPHPGPGPEGLVLEVFNAIGQSLNVVIVTDEDIEALNENEILAVRQLA